MNNWAAKTFWLALSYFLLSVSDWFSGPVYINFCFFVFVFPFEIPLVLGYW